MGKACQHQKLVQSDICAISYCADCGKMNLALGAITLHLTVKQVEEIAATMQSGLKIIAERAETSEALALTNGPGAGSLH
ncbi:MAG: hypothetical protein OIF40_13025 [Mangrovicoccus sp.]|nr:hypothetical protein [Mangrovicoccus sp.]